MEKRDICDIKMSCVSTVWEKTFKMALSRCDHEQEAETPAFGQKFPTSVRGEWVTGALRRAPPKLCRARLGLRWQAASFLAVVCHPHHHFPREPGHERGWETLPRRSESTCFLGTEKAAIVRKALHLGVWPLPRPLYFPVSPEDPSVYHVTPRRILACPGYGQSTTPQPCDLITLGLTRSVFPSQRLPAPSPTNMSAPLLSWRKSLTSTSGCHPNSTLFTGNHFTRNLKVLLLRCSLFCS